jgi:hypothetical protein
MDRSSITPEVRCFTDEGGASKPTAGTRRPVGVRPPDQRDEALPETLPASAVKSSRGTTGDTDVTDLAPRDPCRVRIVNVGSGRVAVEHTAGAAELGPSSYVEVVLDVPPAALLVTLTALLNG